MPRARPLIAAAGVALVWAGCGDRNQEMRPATRPAADVRPQVEGTWRMVRNPRARAVTTVATWRLEPACRSAGCFIVRSSSGRTYRFALDPRTVGYTSAVRFPARCTPRTRGARPRTLTIATTTTLRVVKDQGRGERRRATEMVGESVARLLPERLARTCRERAVQQYDIRGVRTDRPPAPEPRPPDSAQTNNTRPPQPPQPGDRGAPRSPLDRLLDHLPGPR